MISENNFKIAIKLLQEHFGRNLTDAASVIYFEYLNQHTSDAGLTAAVKSAIAESRFMPTAKELVEFSIQAAQEKRQNDRALPPGQEEFSAEEIRENLRKISEICRQMSRKKSFPGSQPQQPKPDYEAMSKDLIKAWERQGYLDATN